MWKHTHPHNHTHRHTCKQHRRQTQRIVQSSAPGPTSKNTAHCAKFEQNTAQGAMSRPTVVEKFRNHNSATQRICVPIRLETLSPTARTMALPHTTLRRIRAAAVAEGAGAIGAAQK